MLTTHPHTHTLLTLFLRHRLTKTLDTTLNEVGNSLRLMEHNEMDSSEREEKLRHNLGQMKARFTEVKNTVNAEGEQSASGS